MTKILFVRQPHIYLPELSAYKHYLKEKHPDIEVFESDRKKSIAPDGFDIIWHFMGIDANRKTKAYTVHEYNSLSTRPLAKIKNRIKRIINRKPDKRIFLNETVYEEFSFKDNIPHHLRDMGIDKAFFEAGQKRKTNPKPKYDFIYAGSLDRGTVINRFLHRFSKNMHGFTLLLLGDASEELKNEFGKNKNIIFKGRIPYKEIPELMTNTRYGLNLMPDIYPFNIQTATKVLEYNAAGLPVVTTNYKWINEFEKNCGGKFFKLQQDMNNLTPEKLENFTFKTADVTNQEWNNIIDKSGIFDFLF